MKLVGFKRMNKQKKIIVSSIVGILLILGSILLYRSYALYEEEKEFNVLKGKIPDFGYDIKMLSVVVDGEKSKTIPTRGLYKTQIDCSNGTTGKWDYNAWNLTLENVSENARCNITFTSNLSEEEYNKYIEAGKALRRNTYRGKDITNYHEDGSLYEMISSGRFDDIYVGDYIVANNITWLVADIDNYLYTGYKSGVANNGSLIKHHLTIIPARYLTTSVMNDTDTTEGGYYNSKMKQETLPNILSTYVEPVFGTHILTYYNLLTHTVDKDIYSKGINAKGISIGADYYLSKIDLMSEMNVYGATFTSSNYLDTGIDNRQYALFRLKPELINRYDTKQPIFGYWLKDVVSASHFATVRDIGSITFQLASVGGTTAFNGGIRPRFLIG